jgi:hypothetical protein
MNNPGLDQISAATGAEAGERQESYIVSGDVMYDLYPWLSVGGKYGARVSDDSSAHLGVARADVHVTKKWDLLLEGRALMSPEADTTDYGLVTSVSRHLGDNFKVGVGYNFGRFSDDLRDTTLDDQGLFVNFVAKF